MDMSYGNQECDTGKLDVSYDEGVLQISGLEQYTNDGAFEQDLKLSFEW